LDKVIADKNESVKHKNILFLCSWYPSTISPFNGNFIFKHARSVVKQGVPITALGVYENLSIKKKIEIEEGEEDGVKHIIIYYSYPFKIFKFWYKFKAYLYGIRYFQRKQGAIDLIHVHVLFDAGFIAWWMYMTKKIPYLITEHSTIFQPYHPNHFSKFLKPFIRKILQKSKYSLPVSNDLAHQIKRIFSKTPTKVIPNVVQTNLFLPPINRQPNSKIKFLHISNFSPQKNIEGLLNGFKKLSEQRKDFSLTLAGDGDLEDLKHLIQKFNFPQGVIFYQGKMDEQQVADNFNSHDAFVLFSDYENLPCVLVEAQVSGMPIIATDVGGVKEIVDSSDCGIIINKKDEKALLESLNQMIENFDVFQRDQIRSKAIEKYGEDAVGQEMISIYNEILNNDKKNIQKNI